MSRKGQLPHVNMGGKQRPVKFGTNATAIFCDLHGIRLKDYEQDFQRRMESGDVSLTEFRDLVYSALYAGHQSRFGEEPEFTKFQVGDWFDEMTADEAEKINQAFVDSMPQSNGQGQGGKKKAPQKKAG